MTSEQDKRSSLERFLGLFTEVRAGEAATVLVLALNIFLILAAYYLGHLIPIFGINQLILVSAAILVSSLLLTNLVESRERGQAYTESEAVEEPLGKSGALELLFKWRHLLLIAFLIFILNWVNTTGEYILGRTVRDAAVAAASSLAAAESAVEDFIGSFYADFFTVVNIAGLVLQLFVVSRILKCLGARIALLTLPMIALGGYIVAAVFPVLAIIRSVKIAENSTDYSLQNTVRQILFLPVTREEKYKAKQAIDTLFQRGGDVMSALTVFLVRVVCIEHAAIRVGQYCTGTDMVDNRVVDCAGVRAALAR